MDTVWIEYETLCKIEPNRQHKIASLFLNGTRIKRIKQIFKDFDRFAIMKIQGFEW